MTPAPKQDAPLPLPGEGGEEGDGGEGGAEGRDINIKAQKETPSPQIT